MDADLLKIVIFVLAFPALLGITKVGALLFRRRESREWNSGDSLVESRLAASHEEERTQWTVNGTHEDWDWLESYNPATGFPMVGGVDTAGNPYGCGN